MTAEPRHLRIVGDRRADRIRCARQFGASTVTAGCHRRLRGPYTGVDTVLRAVLPRAARDWPELVEAHRMELLYGIPELAELIGPPPRTLASDGPFDQRTRYYGAGMIRCMNQGVVTFLLAHAERVLCSDGLALSLHFEDVPAAEPTTQELIALLVRRADPGRLRVVVSGPDTELPSELAAALRRFTDQVDAPARPVRSGDRDPDELVRAYLAADGTSDDPEESAAYHGADPDLVRRLHDERADELTPGAGWGTRIGAITYHRERGTDPSGAGRRALVEAFQFCVEAGFSAAIVDLGSRGRVVTDPAAHPKQFHLFTQHAASALVPLGRPDDAFELYQDLRRRYTDPKVHMTTSYGIAMLYTRFFTPRDHETAIAWQHNACALASVLPDPDDRRTFEVFHANGLALIEMHRGNLDRALELVQGGIDRLDRELDEQSWALHRSQLLYNRARLRAALGRSQEAYTDFCTLIQLDPHYTDYLSERAKISRKRGDLDTALADYDRAVAMAPPFPELYYSRGTARVEVGDIEGALADFGYVLEMEPDDVDTRLSRAELLLRNNEPAAAELDVRTGLALAPAEPRLLCMRGAIAVERDEPSSALEYLDAALDADPGYPAALVNRAVARFRLNRPLAAADDLTRALDIVGADPDVLLNRGLAYLAAERLESALADFDAALACPDADVAELRYQRGRCLIELDRRAQGEADLRECLRLGEYTDEIHELLATPDMSLPASQRSPKSGNRHDIGVSAVAGQ